METNSTSKHWTLSQVQLEALLCRGYTRLFASVCNSNKALEFAADNTKGTQLRRGFINKVFKSDDIQKILKDANLPLVWPEQPDPKVRYYTLEQEKTRGIFLGPSEIVFSWPRRSRGVDNPLGGSLIASQDPRCLENSNVKAFDETDFPLNKYLSGTTISEVLKVFESTIHIALQHPEIAQAYVDHEDAADSILRKSYVQRFLRQLPRHLRLKFDKTQDTYSVKYEAGNGDESIWTLSLPMKIDSTRRGLATPSLRFSPRVMLGCPPPCDGAENKS